jgi:hypothetical protein
MLTVAGRSTPPHAPGMFLVTEADAAAIRAVYRQRGEFWRVARDSRFVRSAKSVVHGLRLHGEGLGRLGDLYRDTGRRTGVALRNVSTTLIHPGSEFKLCFRTSIERLSAGQVYRLFALGLADRRLNRRRAWTRMALRNETQWKPAQETWREGRRRPSFPKTMPGRGKARAVSLTSM